MEAHYENGGNLDLAHRGSPTFDEHREALHLASERPGGEASLSRLNELRKRIERE